VAAHAALAVVVGEAAETRQAVDLARAAAVDVGLVAVRRAVGARGRQAHEVLGVAHVARAVAPVLAGAAVGAVRVARAAAVDVGLVAVVDAVGAGAARAEPVVAADAAAAVGPLGA